MTTSISPQTAPGTRLRELLRTTCVGMPGAFNGMSALQVRAHGFEAAYVSGAAVTASAGVPDVGMLTLTEFCAVIQQVTRGSQLPVLADADTGFGEAEMVQRVVHEYARAGAAGFHIEDQVFPKRCGHLDGKQLVSIDHFQEKIAAACRARDAIDGVDRHPGSFVVCARTDARSVEGMDAVIERAKAFVDAGADMIFPEGLATEHEFGQVAEALAGYGSSSGADGGPFLLANMTEFGKTPIIPLSLFAKLGYHAVIWPVSTFRIAMGATDRFLKDLKHNGHVEGSLDEMMTRKELYDFLGYTPGDEWTCPQNM